MTKNKKVRRNSGRIIPKYIEKIPFNIREQLDIIEYRIKYDNWIDFRDEYRTPIEKNKLKYLKNNNIKKFRNIKRALCDYQLCNLS